MTLEPGQLLAHYRLIEKIGEGGMGVVWRAADTKLGRDVALKILPEVFARDPERRTRFGREARLLASLNHTNIAAIHGFEQADGFHFLVLEMVPGVTLAERVAQGPIEIAEALAIARQIAEGVEAAHSKGIIHRDLKPANVKVTEGGEVKVLDFGLAKAFSEGRPPEALSQSPTITEMATRDGIVLGTAAYMSPEQAKARTVDHRTDIWAFGCVLYEILTGRAAFVGESVATTLANILEHEPDWEALPARLPRQFERLVRRCLTRDVTRRLQAIGEARIVLQEPMEASTVSTEAVTVPSASPWRRVAPWVLLPLAIAVGWFVRPTAHSLVPPVLRLDFALPAGERLTHGHRHGVAISPDGRAVAFVSGTGERLSLVTGTQLWLRRLGEWEARPIPGTDGGFQPVFSPDGTWLAFAVNTTDGWFLRKVPLAGGEPVTVCGPFESPFGASWGPDDTIVFADGFAGGLMRVSALGGEPEALTEPDPEAGEMSHRLPHWLPDGRTVLFTAVSEIANVDWSRARVEAVSVETTERKTILTGGADARYLPTGHLLYAREGTLTAVPFDVERLQVTGPEIPVQEGVSHSIHSGAGDVDTGTAHFAVSPTGALVYAAGSVIPELHNTPVWVDRAGQEEPVGVDRRRYFSVRISPDGRHALFTSLYRPATVWLYESERRITRRQTFEGNAEFAIWGPGRDHFTFGSDREGPVRYLYSKRIDAGSGGAQRLSTEIKTVSAGSWSPDGKRLVFVVDGGEQRSLDVGILDADGRSEPFLESRFTEGWPEFSPDGRWIVYCSFESGRPQVYVRPHPGPGPAVQISTEGGCSPAWSRDGREIFYRRQRGFFAVSIDASGDRLTPGSPVRLFAGDYEAMAPVRSYDVAPDGRFLLIKVPDPAHRSDRLEQVFPDRIRVVQNWFEELRAKTGTGG